jgi:hypothetical protein
MVKEAAKWVLHKLRLRHLVRPATANQPATNPETVTPFVPPGHFYSPIPDLAKIEVDAPRLYAPPGEDGVDYNLATQLRLIEEFAQYVPLFDWPMEATPGKRYYAKNDQFGAGDALILSCMIRQFQPKRIIEAGSGYSSSVMLDLNDQFTDRKMDLCFIEPYPDRLEGGAHRIRGLGSERHSLHRFLARVQSR